MKITESDWPGWSDKKPAAERKPKGPRADPPKYTKEQQLALGEAAFSRKMEASDSTVIVRGDPQWKRLHEDWFEWGEDDRKDVVFGLAYYSGFKAKDIARLFRIKPADLAHYKDIIDQGLVALKHKITSNQIAFGLMTDQPVVKFHLGKQFAEQVDNPAHEGVDSVSDGPPTIIVNEVKADNKDLRDELESAVQTAIALAGAKSSRTVQ